MTKVAEKLQELQIITAEQGEDEDAIVAAIATLHQDNAALAESNAALVTENNRYKIEAERAASAAADTVIQAAIDEGKFSEAQKELVAHWKAEYIKDPEKVKRIFASWPSSSLLQRQITVKAGDGRRLMATADDRAQLQHQQKLAVAEIMAANPNMSRTDAFNKARRDRPEVFPPEAVEA